MCNIAQSTEVWLYFILVAAGGPRYEFGGIEDWTGDIATDEPEANKESEEMRLLINDEEKLRTLSENAKKMGNPNVINDIIKAIEEL